MRWIAIVMLMTTAAGAADTLIPFRIQDQFDHLHTHMRYGGRPLLVVWVDRAGNDFREAWTDALGDSLSTELARYRLRELEVAHVKGVPFFVKGKVKGAFGDEPVLMDWEGEFAAAYRPVADHVNLLLFDAEGDLTRQWAVTAPDSAILGEVLAAARSLAR